MASVSRIDRQSVEHKSPPRIGGAEEGGATAEVSEVQTRRRVQLLDIHTINQIAAGEVVERPSAVVKELVENSLDAGARRIEIEIKAAGRELIRVADDGCGMDREDLLASLQRHATSKIRIVDDLRKIDSLGFRGEAIPSIASVSKLRLASGSEGEARVRVSLEGGRLKKEDVVAGPRGTEIEVQELFFNLPVRLKFLRSDTTEQTACIEMASRYALAYPHVRFVMRNEHGVLLETSGSGDAPTAIAEVWGRDLVRAMVPLESFVAGVRVRGYCSPPHITKPSRTMQSVFVNGRPVKARTVFAAIDSAYKSLTPERRYPVVVLFLDVDPARVDANVSPTKSEVKFQGEGAVFDAVRLALKDALLASGMVPDASDIARAEDALRGQNADPGQMLLSEDAARLAKLSREVREDAPFGSWTSNAFDRRGDGPMTDPAAGEIADKISFAGAVVADTVSRDAVMRNPERGADRERMVQGSLTSATGRPFARLAEDLRILGQAMLTFIVCETRSGLAIIDQHVAHERVLYEYLCGMRGRVPVERQALLAPEPVALDRRIAASVFERIDDLHALGFDCEPFGADSLLVRSVPAAIAGKNPLAALREVADELAEGGLGPKPAREKIWIMCACKMAVKAGDRLTMDEMNKLILDLAATENPYLCPHGRPITVTLDARDLLRKFGRS